MSSEINTLPLGASLYIDCITQSPSTGAATDVDAAGVPTVEIFEDANDTAIMTPTAVKRTSKTGDYRIPLVLTTANGYEISKSYNVVVSALVGGVTGKFVAATFTIGPPIYHCGTAQAGAAGSITLATTAVATDDYYVGQLVYVFEGAGLGQVRLITAYVGSTRVASVEGNWATNPGGTSLYQILPGAKVQALSAAGVTAVQSGLASATDLTTVAGYIDTEIGTLLTNLAAVGTDVSQVLEDTSDIMDDIAAVDDEIAAVGTTVDAIKALTDTLAFEVPAFSAIKVDDSYISPTATSFGIWIDDYTQKADNFFRGALVRFTAGALIGEYRQVISSAATDDPEYYTLVVDAPFSDAPTLTDYVTFTAASLAPTVDQIFERLYGPALTVATGTSATSFTTTDLAPGDGDADYYKDALFVFGSGGSGDLFNQVKKCTSSSYSTGTTTLNFSSGYTGAPTAGDPFYLINK